MASGSENLSAAAGAGAGAGAGSVNNARTRTLKNVYKKHFKNSNFKTNFEPLPRTLYKEPICDPIGYSQHSGECWSDTIQQLVLFSDGLKEYTQPYYYNTPFHAIEAKIDRIVDAELAPVIKNYVKAMQDRFINHYNLIVSGDERFVECAVAPYYRNILKKSNAHKLYRQRSLVMALDAARSIVGYEKDTSGAIFDEYKKIYNILVKLTNDEFSIDLKNYNDLTSTDTVFGYHLNGFMMTKFASTENDFELLFERGNSGHAMGLLKCNKKVFFYDNNSGLFEISFPFDEIKNVSCVVLGRDFETRKVKLYFLSGKIDIEIISKQFQKLVIKDGKLWSDTAWTDLEGDFLIDNSPLIIFNIYENRYALTKVGAKSSAPAPAHAGAGVGGRRKRRGTRRIRK